MNVGQSGVPRMSLSAREYGAIYAHAAALVVLRDLRAKAQRDFDDADRAREFGEVLAVALEARANG